MSFISTSDGLGDAAERQQLAAGKNQVEQVQQHVQPAVYLFLAKMLVRRQRHQHGAAAHSPALESSNQMWQLAVLARFAKRSRADLWGDDLLIPNIGVEDFDHDLGQLC